MKLSDSNSIIYLLKGGCFCNFCSKISDLCITPSIRDEIVRNFKNNEGNLNKEISSISQEYNISVDIASFKKEYSEFLKGDAFVILDEAKGHPTTAINFYKKINKSFKCKGDTSIVAHILWGSTPIVKVITSDHDLIKIVSVYKNSQWVIEVVLDNCQYSFSPKQIRYLFDSSMGHYVDDLRDIKNFNIKYGGQYLPKVIQIKERVDKINFSGAVILPD